MKKYNKVHSISTSLILAFVIVLLLFSVLISILFGKFYTEHVFQTDLLNTNINLCSTITDYLQEEDIEFSSLNVFHNRRDFSFLKNITAMEDVEVWLITSDRKVISYNEEKGIIEADEIPTRYHEMVEELFAGKNIETQPYKQTWNRNMIGVGAPIMKEERIVGAALMQMDKNQVFYAAAKTLKALMACLLIAIPIVTMIAIFLAKAMMQPLKKLKNTARELWDGNYEIKTEVKRKDEIGLLAEMIDKLAIRLKEAKQHREVEDEMRNNFLSGISHELRTPISVIKVQLEALSDGVITEEKEREEYYHSMRAEINGLQRLVNDLLDLSKLSSREFHMKIESVNLWDVLNNSVRGIRAYATQKNISILLTTEGKNANTVLVKADYDRLRQLFLIFMDNAIKYSDCNTSVEVCLHVGKKCEVQICDHGYGIPEEEIPFIFERFYRGKKIEKVTGSGLGLPIAQQIATQLGIELSISSKQASGTMVTMRFLDLV